ncbi:MAG: hypothetical protein IKE93_01825 [Erysipelotrichaceae bacterium]|nr:hypothetical protein [Erysipelotrichaceae bacterium]
MNIIEKSTLIRQGKLGSTELCEDSLGRIAANDQDGLKLNSVSEINPNWYFEARALDGNPDKAEVKSPLYGIPVLLKDNIDVKGLHTTAGSFALSDLIADKDSFLAGKLKEAGAVILGKTNLSEFAYWMSEEGMPSGYSSLSGQVVHPYNPEYDPSGSSSGSAVAVAAGFVDVSIGTETDGSLMSPAISNSIVSIKPTVGLVSRSGILPISNIQDTAGPMARNVTDCAALLQVIAGKDPDDPATWNCHTDDYLSYLKNDLKGKRIGVFTAKELKCDEEYLRKLKEIIVTAQGECVDIYYENTYFDEMIPLTYEFKNGINSYLAQHNSSCRSLDDIIGFNNRHAERCLKHGQSLLIASNNTSGFLKEKEYLKKRAELREQAYTHLDKVIDDNHLDCLVTVCGHAPTNLAAISGNCSMVLPARKPDEEKYDPLSFYMLGKAYKEGELINLAYVLEQALKIDARPSWLKQ